MYLQFWIHWQWVLLYKYVYNERYDTVPYCILHCLLDINECNDSTSVCGDNAICNDTQGSYICTCQDGFSGDGFNCSGVMITVMCLEY